MPKVSIILPCYNVEKYVAKSIQSVLNQTYTDFELLVIIDGSPDNSKAVAEMFADERITIFEKSNGGLSDARNYGLERAKGEFVYFMDSDDWIEPDLVEKTIEVLEEKHLNAVVFGYIQDDEDKKGKLIASTETIPPLISLQKRDSNVEVDAHLLGLLGYAWNKVYRRSFLTGNNLYFEKRISLVEDILFNVQVYEKMNEIHFINKPFYHYMNRPSATLIKQFHPDSFQLKLKRNIVLQQLFENWNFQNKEETIAFSQIHGIRYCIHNMFSYKNDLSFKEKTTYIQEMLSHPFTREVIGSYHPKTTKDKVFQLLIKNRQAFLLAVLAQIIK